MINLRRHALKEELAAVSTRMDHILRACRKPQPPHLGASDERYFSRYPALRASQESHAVPIKKNRFRFFLVLAPGGKRLRVYWKPCGFGFF